MKSPTSTNSCQHFYLYLFYYHYIDGYKLVSHMLLIYDPIMTRDVEHFPWADWTLKHILGKMCFQIFCPVLEIDLIFTQF
jgi:hypothetical protein